MIYLLGNCQLEFLGNALRERGMDAIHKPVPSPLTMLSAKGTPDLMTELNKHFGLEEYMHGRTLANQFEPLGAVLRGEEPPPSLVVVNLFHENEPLFSQNDEKFIFFLDPAAWADNQGIERWMKRQCSMIKPNPKTYMKRFVEMFVHLKKTLPATPFLLVNRLHHYPAFGPNPYSYLKGWESLQWEADAVLKRLAETLPGVFVLDMNRVFAGIWNNGERSIDAHCPFLRVGAPDENTNGALRLERDLEHVGSLWPRLAEKIREFQASGKIEYESLETPPASWMESVFQPEILSRAAQVRLLSSGSNYSCARAIGSFYHDLNRDYSKILAEHGESMPVCHNMLHMIDKYSRIQNNEVLADWCRAHKRTASGFENNGALFRKLYLERLESIETRLSGARINAGSS